MPIPQIPNHRRQSVDHPVIIPVADWSQHVGCAAARLQSLPLYAPVRNSVAVSGPLWGAHAEGPCCEVFMFASIVQSSTLHRLPALCEWIYGAREGS